MTSRARHVWPDASDRRRIAAEELKRLEMIERLKMIEGFCCWRATAAADGARALP